MRPVVRDAVVFAGGLGTRLGQLGAQLPKALLPIHDGRVLVDVVVSQLRESGVRRVVFALGHRSHQVVDHVGDGARLGVDAEYLFEDLPLGTAGALGRLGPMRERFIVTNCDVVTDLRLADAVETHRATGAELTICARRLVERSEYGVLEVEDPTSRSSRLVQMREKPIERRLVNMGIYVLEPTVLDVIRRDERTDMDAVIGRLLAASRAVATHAHDGAWTDVGSVERLEVTRRTLAAPEERVS